MGTFACCQGVQTGATRRCTAWNAPIHTERPLTPVTLTARIRLASGARRGARRRSRRSVLHLASSAERESCPPTEQQPRQNVLFPCIPPTTVLGAMRVHILSEDRIERSSRSAFVMPGCVIVRVLA